MCHLLYTQITITLGGLFGSSFGKKNSGIDMNNIMVPQMKKPIHQAPIHSGSPGLLRICPGLYL